MVGDRLLRVLHHALVVVLVVGIVGALSAQAVLDPRYVEFDASADHNALAESGIPLVSSYSLAIYPVGSSTPFATVSLGKPTPGTGGVIRVDFLPLLTTLPTPGVNYEARVSAVGPGGTTASTNSNQFSFSPTCAPAISPTSRSVTQAETPGNVSVTVAPGCTWSAVSNAPWITLTGATSGNGNGSVPYNVAANTTTSQRVGTVTIAGQTFSVTQAAATACTFSISPSGQTVAASGGTASTTVTASASSCGWTAVSNDTNWLSVTTGATGTGTGTASFTATANTGTTQRQGTITIAGRTFTVTQPAATTTCTFSISPSGQTVAASGGTASTTVTASAASCGWTAVSNNTAWLLVTTGATGTGTGTASFTASANTGTTQRQGTVTIAGQTFTVTQPAPTTTCTFSISPSSQTVAANGGTASTTVTASASSCGWTAVSNSTTWLSVTTGATGTGTGTASFTATANTGSTQRQGIVTIAGRTFTVTQPGNGCTYSLSPNSRSVSAQAGNTSTFISTGSACVWEGTTTAAWITITTSDGTGSGSLTYSYAANPGSAPRTGTINIADRVHTVTQAGSVPPTAPANLRIVSIGGQ